MLYKLYISREESLVTVVPTGTYSIEDFKKLLLLVIRDPLYKPRYNHLMDFREVKYTPVLDELREMASFIATFSTYYKGGLAMLVASDIHFSMFSIPMKAIALKGIRSRIFLDHGGALEWLRHLEN